MLLEVPGTIRAPRHTFFMNKMYKNFAAGHHKSGHHGHHSPGFACFQQGKITRKMLAETVGFEPTCPFGQLDFESSSL